MNTPQSIQAIGNDIAILWDDRVESYYPMEVLRASSPSAENVGERDLLGNVIGGSSQTAFPGVTVRGWQIVGGYALQFDFSDGHNTGLFSYEYLRALWEHLDNPATDDS